MYFFSISEQLRLCHHPRREIFPRMGCGNDLRSLKTMFFFDQNKKHLEIFVCILYCPNAFCGCGDVEKLYIPHFFAIKKLCSSTGLSPLTGCTDIFVHSHHCIGGVSVLPVCCKPNLKHFWLISYNLEFQWVSWHLDGPHETANYRLQRCRFSVAHYYARIHPQSGWCARVWTRERKVWQLSVKNLVRGSMNNSNMRYFVFSLLVLFFLLFGKRLVGGWFGMLKGTFWGDAG